MTKPISITPLTCEIPEPRHEELWIITHGTPVDSVNFSAETLQCRR